MTDALLDRLDPRFYPEVARLLLNTPTVGWVMAGEESPSDNPGAFARHRLVPRVMRDVSAVSTATTLQGTAVRTPIGIAPMGLQKALHPDGEVATATGAARAGATFIVGVNATVSITDIAAAVPGANLWLQLYNWPDRDALAAVVAQAQKAGVTAIVPLVNTPLPASHTPASVGFRLPPGAELQHGAGNHPVMDATNDEGYVRWLADLTSLPIVPKGIVAGDDARRALDAGARGILVSNHGNRQVARSIATLDALPGVVAAVGDRTEVYLDGGVRSGTDALIALALGARAVFCGRSVAWALAVGGADGVAKVLDSMTAELALEGGMCGVTDVTAVPADLVVPAPGAR